MKLKTLSLCRLVALLGLASSLFAADSASLQPSKDMAAQTRWVVNTIHSRHYLRESMQQLDGQEIIEAYIKSFDYSKMHFTRPQVDDFIFRFASATEGFFEKGNLYAAFEIYETYKDAVQARTDWVYKYLDGPIEFSAEETFTPDRREVDWPENDLVADRIWEQRVKYQLLNELLSLASESEADETPAAKKNLDASLDEPHFDPEKLRRLLNDKTFYEDTLDQARAKIRRRYERQLGQNMEREAAEVQEVFINAMTQLFDPHSSFLSSDTLESFNSSVQNSFVGIGAMLEDKDGICTVKEILPGGPAEESGLLGAEDQILGVAQGKNGEFEDVVDMQLRYIVRKIKGEKNTIVRLLIHPGDAADPSVRKDITIVRGEVKLTANLATGKLIQIPQPSGEMIPVGVIELPSFYGNIGGGSLTTTSQDVSELIVKLKEAKAQGLILDLRMNGGGLLNEAVRVAGLFIPEGPVVQVRDKDGRTDVLSDRDSKMLWSGPLIVLTSRFSASASEIVAGALQDHGRALIVGNSSTHGKGTVQEVYHMSNRPVFSWFNQSIQQTRPVASKITIKQFYLPGGHSTQLRGVPSDIVLDSANEYLPIGESDLPHALPWDSIESLDCENEWSRLNISSPLESNLLQQLGDASEQRQESMEEFVFLEQQVAWRRKRIEEKDISLNLNQRIHRQIEEQAQVERLDESYEALRQYAYNSEPVRLQLAEEQEAISKANIEKTESAHEEELAHHSEQADASEAVDPEKEEKPFDIHLRETGRIMADWIRLEEDPQNVRASLDTTSDLLPAAY
ncbi:MAG: carboxy terminal-processing peptidase [Coraliomargaritaceae bacterium]